MTSVLAPPPQPLAIIQQPVDYRHLGLGRFVSEAGEHFHDQQQRGQDRGWRRAFAQIVAPGVELTAGGESSAIDFGGGEQ